MTDATNNPGAAAPAPARKGASLLTLDENTKKRNRAEVRFRSYGIAAIAIGLAFLVMLVWSILSSGLPAFTRTVVEIQLTVTQEEYAEAEDQLFFVRHVIDREEVKQDEEEPLRVAEVGEAREQEDED